MYKSYIGIIWGYYVEVTYRHYVCNNEISAMENQMEKNIEYEMENVCYQICGDCVSMRQNFW